MAVRQALLWALTSRYTSAAITFAGAIALARLLTPAETGIYSVAAGLVALVQILRDFGIGTYIVRLPELDRERLENAFGLALVASWTLGAALALAAPAAAALYGEPGLTLAIRVLAINFLILPFNLPTLAVLRREMRFRALFRIGLAGTITLIGVGVALAAVGFSYMAMVYASVAQTVVIAVAAALTARAAYVTRPRFNRWREVARFGGTLTLVQAINEVGVEVAPLVIGRMVGLAEAGLYSKANSTLKFSQQGFMSAIGAVALPAVAGWRREGRALGPLYRRKIVYLAAVLVPLHAVLALLAYPLVLTLFGANWLGVVPVIWLLSISALALPLVAANSEFLMAYDQLGTELRLRAINTAARMIAIGAAAAYWRTLIAAAAAMTVVRLMNGIQYQAALGRLLGIGWRAAGGALVSCLPLTLGAAAGPAALIMMFGRKTGAGDALLMVVLGGPLALAGSLAAALLVRHPIRDEARWLMRQGAAAIRGAARGRR